MADYSAFLEDNPEIAYHGFLDQLRGISQNFANSNTNRMQPRVSNAFVDYFRNRYQQVYDAYSGQLGRQALGGQVPNLSWMDFLKGQSNTATGFYKPTTNYESPMLRAFNRNPLMEEWLNLAPWQRGQMRTPVVQWNLGR